MTDFVREVRLLSRIQLLRFAGINSLIHGHDRKQRLRALGVTAIWLLIGCLAALYPVVFVWTLSEVGAMDVIPRAYALVIAMITLMTIVMKGPQLIFGGGDTEQLRAMPVRTGAIVLSRMLAVLVPEVLLALLVAVPTAIACASCGMEAGQAARLAAALLFIPAIPTALALLIGVAVSYVTRRLRHRALVSGVLSIALLVGVMGIAVGLGFGAGTGAMTDAMLMVLFGRFADLLAGLYPPADWVAQAAQGSASAFIWLAVTALIALGAAGVLSALGFGRIVDALSSSGAKRASRAGRMRRRPPLMALLSKEALRLVSSGVYMMNVLVGHIMVLLSAAAVLMIDVRPYLPVLALLPEWGGQLYALLPLLPALMAAMAPLTACAVSLEGEQMELMRAMPVSMRTWLGAKLLLDLAIAVPALLLSCAVFCVRLALTPAQCLLMMIYPLCTAAFSGVFSLMMNLCFPKFDWTQETQVVKQGVAVFLSMLVGMLSQIAVGLIAVITGLGAVVVWIAAGVQAALAAAGFAWMCHWRMP